MRFRPISFLASATVLFLWGCPAGNAPSTDSSPSDATAANASNSFGNTDAHTDAVDSPSDVSWAGQVQVPSGSAATRVLMTDAPVDADHVFITFCGVRVAKGGGADSAQGGDSAGSGDSEHASGAADAGVAHDDSELEVSVNAQVSAGSAGHDDGAAGAPSTEPQDPPSGAAGAPSGQPRDPATGAGDDGASKDDHSAADAGPSGSDPSGSEGGGWISLSTECRTIDLLSLQNGITEDIGINALPAGTYGQIRLMLTDASIVKNGVTQALTVPSGSESGIKIVGGFSIVEGQPTTVTIDFDAGSSIHYTAGQGFLMNPVIKIVNVTAHGDGNATTGDGSAHGAAGASGDQPSTMGDNHAPGAAGATGTAGAAGSSGEEHATDPAPTQNGDDPSSGSGGASGDPTGDHASGGTAGSSGEAGQSSAGEGGDAAQGGTGGTTAQN